MFSRASSYETISENQTSQWNGFIGTGRASSSQPPQPRHHGILRRAICFVCTRCYGFEKKQFHSLFHGSTRWDPWSNFDAINLGDDYFWIRSENFLDSPKGISASRASCCLSYVTPVLCSGSPWKSDHLIKVVIQLQRLQTSMIDCKGLKIYCSITRIKWLHI